MRLNVIPQRKPGSAFALAVALACGTAVAAVGVAEPAYAQKKKKKKEEKAAYSKEFVAAYSPLEEALNAEGADIGALGGQISQVAGLAQSGDEKLAAGNLIYNAGAKSSNQALQLQGMEMMIASGKVGIEAIGQYNFVAYQLANSLQDFGKARSYLEQAINLNYSNAQISTADLSVAMAESYFSENRHQDGLDYLSGAIATRKAAGGDVPESWYRRGLQVGYSNDIQPQVYDFVVGWVANYPNETNWRDAINIARNLNNYEPAEMLDLLRLAYSKGTMTEKIDYIEFVEAADPRRLPQEVIEVIEQGYALGRVSRDDIYISDSLATAKSRVAADRSDLPALERDARAADAGLRTVVAAGNAFLNYGEYAKAEEFFTKALTMPGADTELVETRLGIAQARLGKEGEAAATFAGITGKRAPIARLWATAVAENATPAPAPAAAAAEEVEPATGG